ncbi:hypothetical protein F4859DRAFT_486591 [Xylaria cf. heliscus]|nr:hypothetical protein F4859DRAFT_486591 [Xylaria cf. heliscus]
MFYKPFVLLKQKSAAGVSLPLTTSLADFSLPTVANSVILLSISRNLIIHTYISSTSHHYRLRENAQPPSHSNPHRPNHSLPRRIRPARHSIRELPAHHQLLAQRHLSRRANARLASHRRRNEPNPGVLSLQLPYTATGTPQLHHGAEPGPRRSLLGCPPGRSGCPEPPHGARGTAGPGLPGRLPQPRRADQQRGEEASAGSARGHAASDPGRAGGEVRYPATARRHVDGDHACGTRVRAHLRRGHFALRHGLF